MKYKCNQGVSPVSGSSAYKAVDSSQESGLTVWELEKLRSVAYQKIKLLKA